MSEKYLVSNCDAITAGLGDRLQGLVCAIVLAKLLKRKLLIQWSNLNIDKLFDMSEYDFVKYRNNHPNINNNSIVIDAVHLQTNAQRFFEQPNILAKLEPFQTILFKCNTNPLVYLYKNIGIPKDTYEVDFKQACSSLFTTYLKPKGELKYLVDEYRRRFDRSSSYVVGLQIRTGDRFFSSTGMSFFNVDTHCKEIVQIVSDKLQLLQTQSNIEKYDLFITYDNPAIIPHFDEILNNPHVGTVHYVNIELGHYHYTGTSVQLSTKLFADMILLGLCDKLIVSYVSNFGRIPYIGLNTQDKFAIEMPNNNDENKFRITSPSITEMSCKHDHFKIL